MSVDIKKCSICGETADLLVDGKLVDKCKKCYAGVKKICVNAITYAFLPEAERQLFMRGVIEDGNRSSR